MKVLIGAVAVVILLIGAQSAFALTEYERGFLQGVHDMIHNHFIVLTTKYTHEYVNGYNHGLTAAYPATMQVNSTKAGTP